MARSYLISPHKLFDITGQAIFSRSHLTSRHKLIFYKHIRMIEFHQVDTHLPKGHWPAWVCYLLFRFLEIQMVWELFLLRHLVSLQPSFSDLMELFSPSKNFVGANCYSSDPITVNCNRSFCASKLPCTFKELQTPSLLIMDMKEAILGTFG